MTQPVRGLPWPGSPRIISFHRKRAVSAEVCRAGGSCNPSDRAHFTKIASIKLLQDRCSRAAASRIHRIQACEPRTDNPGCALIPPPVAVLTACLPPENSSHLHTNTRVNHTASVFASPFLATSCGFQAPRPNEPRRNRAHFFLTDFARQRRAAGRRGPDFRRHHASPGRPGRSAWPGSRRRGPPGTVPREERRRPRNSVGASRPVASAASPSGVGAKGAPVRGVLGVVDHNRTCSLVSSPTTLPVVVGATGPTINARGVWQLPHLLCSGV